MPAIPVWAARMRMGSPYAYGLRKMAHMRMGSPYAYGTAHTRTGKIRIWDGTSSIPQILLSSSQQSKIKFPELRVHSIIREILHLGKIPAIRYHGSHQISGGINYLKLYYFEAKPSQINSLGSGACDLGEMRYIATIRHGPIMPA